MSFKTLDKISEIFGWIKIVFSLTLLGTAIGSLIYYFSQNIVGLIIGIAVSLFALIRSIFYANKIWKTKGTVWLVSRVSATPELDEENQNK